MDCKKNKCSTIFRDCDKTTTCVDNNILKNGVNLNQLDYYSQGPIFSINNSSSNFCNTISPSSECLQSIQYIDLPNKSIFFDTVRLLFPSIATDNGPLKVEVGIYEVKQTDGTLVIGDASTYPTNSKLIHKTSKTFEQINNANLPRKLGIINIKFDNDIVINNTPDIYYFISIGFFGISNSLDDDIFIQCHTGLTKIEGYSWVNAPNSPPSINDELPPTLSDADITVDTPRPYYLLYKDYYSS